MNVVISALNSAFRGWPREILAGCSFETYRKCFLLCCVRGFFFGFKDERLYNRSCKYLDLGGLAVCRGYNH